MDQERGELIIVGGAAIALSIGGRDSTKDIDSYFNKPEDAAIMRAAARRVASTLDLPEDWLNDGAKGFMFGTEKGPLVFAGENLDVYAVPLAQLLAMKLWAWRDDQDFDDAERLLEHLVAQYPGASQAEIWGKIAKFIPPTNLVKPSYAFEDLWELRYKNDEA